jgi:hypothetical protein
MHPCHKFVDFVEADKDKLDPTVLWRHAAYLDTLAARELPIKDICWFDLVMNPSPHASHIMQRNPFEFDSLWTSSRGAPDMIPLFVGSSKICERHWKTLCANPAPTVLPVVQANWDKINWSWLSCNSAPWAVELLVANPDKVCWANLSCNKASKAIELLQTRPLKIQWSDLSGNSAPEAMSLLRADPGRINWNYLCSNRSPDAGQLLRANHDRIDWETLSGNPSPHAIALLEANPDQIDWYELSSNPGAVYLLGNNLDKIDWTELSENPAIFQMDYAVMRERMTAIREELLRHCMHPSRLHQAQHHWLLL